MKQNNTKQKTFRFEIGIISWNKTKPQQQNRRKIIITLFLISKGDVQTLKQGFSAYSSCSEGQCFHSKSPDFSHSYISCYYWTCYHKVWNIPLISWDHLSFPYLLLIPSLLDLEEWRGVLKLSVLLIAQQQTKHGCNSNAVVATSAKHRMVWTAAGKVNSIPARYSTSS